MFSHISHLSFVVFVILPRDDLQFVPRNGASLLALELSQRLRKARSQVISEPLSKRELAFYSSERDLSPNVTMPDIYK